MTAPVKHPRSPGTLVTPVLRLGVAAAGFTMLTARVASELVYQVRLTLDDDGGPISLPHADGSNPHRSVPDRRA